MSPIVIHYFCATDIQFAAVVRIGVERVRTVGGNIDIAFKLHRVLLATAAHRQIRRAHISASNRCKRVKIGQVTPTSLIITIV